MRHLTQRVLSLHIGKANPKLLAYTTTYISVPEGSLPFSTLTGEEKERLLSHPLSQVHHVFFKPFLQAQACFSAFAYF
jgi:hypothetical protein